MTDPPSPGKPPPLRRRGAARREAIIRAATAAFLQQGYDRTSMADILARAGGSKTFAYAQFGDKAGLLRAVVAELCAEMLAPLDARDEDNKPAAPAEALAAVAQEFLGVLWGEDVQALSRLVFAEGHRHPEVADLFFRHGYDAGFERLADYIGLVAERPMPEDERLGLAMMFLTMVKGDAFDRRLSGASRQRSPDEVQTQIAWAVEWLMERVKADPPNPTRPATQDGP